jgi:hypothetical protein
MEEKVQNVKTIAGYECVSDQLLGELATDYSKRMDRNLFCGHDAQPLPEGSATITIPKADTSGGALIPPLWLVEQYQSALGKPALVSACFADKDHCKRSVRQRPKRVPSYRERQRRHRLAIQLG